MRVIESLLVQRPAAALFWLSQDYARRLEWDPYLSEARLNGAKVAAVGVDSSCKNRSGTAMVSRYITFAPPTHAAVEMVQGPWILAQFGGTWRFRGEGERCTEVRFIYNFKTRPRLLRWLIEPIVGLVYRHDMKRRLLAFKRWAEGEA